MEKLPQVQQNQLGTNEGKQAEGKSMAPPSFQLSASPAAIQAKPDGSGGNNPSDGEAVQFGQVVQRQTPEGEHCVEDKTLASPEWEAFAGVFNQEFASILHIFPQEGCEETTDAKEKKSYVGIGEASGKSVSGIRLSKLFTTGQRDKIMEFARTKVIPERLFNGDDIGSTTAQQRLLMAGHILDVGTYKPSSYEQDVHARMCWHWVHITHHYAGATPSGGLNAGMMGMADHNNDVVFGSGKLTSKFHGKGVKPEDLPAEYDPVGHVGPIPEDTGHKEAYEKEKAKKEANPDAKSTIKMLRTMPFEDFDKIEPGDWIWYYNANGSGVGSHSVIFSRWASDVLTTEDGVRYRKAICFSQGRPESGGREHTANLGERFSKQSGTSISPINYVTSVSADTNPADTVDELLPKGSEKKEKALISANDKYIAKTIEKKFKRPVDRAKVIQKLQGMNKPLIAGLGDRITPGQKEMLEKANASSDIETLVRLYQRISMVLTNTNIIESNQEATNKKTDEAYAKTSEGVAAEEAKIDLAEEKLKAEAWALEDELAGLELRLLEEDILKDELDTAPEVKALGKEFKTLDGIVKKVQKRHKKDPEFLETDPEFKYMKAKRDKMAEDLIGLKATGKTNQKELRAKLAEIQKLKKLEREKKAALKKLGGKFAAQEKKRAAAKKTLPFSLVHPGGWKGQSKAKTTGKIQDVLKVADFADTLVDEEKKPE